MRNRPFPPLEDVRDAFDYDAESGVLSWKMKNMGSRAGGNRYEGRPVGTICANGYLKFGWRERTYLVHRIAYYYATGEQPRCLDHINRNRADNRLSNLRPANHKQNQLNIGLSVRNKSGVKGVCWCKQTRKWRVTVARNGKPTTVGRFDTLDEAREARKAAADKEYGGWARH